MPFRLTNQGEYAVRLMVYLASRNAGQRISAQEIADAQNIPPRFLRNIISEFAKRGFVRSFKGQGGGVELGDGAGDRTLLDIIEAVEGPIYLNVCMQGVDACEFSGQCSVHNVWHEAQDALRGILGSRRLTDMVTDNEGLASLVGVDAAQDICGQPDPERKRA